MIWSGSRQYLSSWRRRVVACLVVTIAAVSSACFGATAYSFQGNLQIDETQSTLSLTTELVGFSAADQHSLGGDVQIEVDLAQFDPWPSEITITVTAGAVTLLNSFHFDMFINQGELRNGTGMVVMNSAPVVATQQPGDLSVYEFPGSSYAFALNQGRLTTIGGHTANHDLDDVPIVGIAPSAPDASLAFANLLATENSVAFDATLTLPLTIDDEVTMSRGIMTVVGVGQLTATGRVVVPLISVPADFDGNRLVNESDLAVWRLGYGRQPAAVTDGDANGDGSVTGADFLIWQEQAGASSAGAAVLEPPAGGLLLLGAFLVCTNGIGTLRGRCCWRPRVLPSRS